VTEIDTAGRGVRERDPAGPSGTADDARAPARDRLTRAELEDRLELHRTELTAYCYRMLGSPFEAEDAVQETMVRAWRNLDRFEGRAALRTWLYRIATNVCMDHGSARARRARPMDLSGPSSPSTAVPAPLPEATWIVPTPDAAVIPGSGRGDRPGDDPAAVAVVRESVRLALVVALQRLAPRQRAVLILREVLSWSASESAELLGTTVASVNSALQRARATLAAAEVTDSDPLRPADEAQRDLLARYVAAFESYDMDALAAILHEDATMSMPPLGLWLRGLPDIRAWMLGTGAGCRGSRLVTTAANGSPAFGQYRPADGGGYDPWALVVLEISAGRIVGINSFLDTERIFPLFGLPARLAV
jgi:RNA polymerase sigma-70 factor (ECF subfamily)